jgi:RHS repeat-associated protein
LVAYTNQIPKVTLYDYDVLGRRITETNANSEIIRYTMSPAGDLLTLTDGKGQVTTWKYDQFGLVTNKLDQATTNILSYKYDANGRLTNRWSKAKGETAYGYDAAGNLTLVNYPSGTTDITLAYDALNRATNMVDAVGTTKYTFTSAGQLLTEDGPWSNDTVTYTYHSSVPGLPTILSLQQPTGSWNHTNSFDAAKRLSSLTSPAGVFAYTYRGPGNLWTNLALPNTSVLSNHYDSSGRQLGTWLRVSGGTVTNKHTYTYNQGHQRTQMVRTDSSYVNYTYDNIGQLKTAIGSGGFSTENLGYLYDTAWNLSKRTNGGATTTFGVNVKNELTNVAATTYTYDGNGNLSSTSGYLSYTYDAENQLTKIEQYMTWKTEFVYDGRSRLRKRLEYTWMGSPYNQWSSATETRYVYDGMRLIQERNSSGTPLVAYVRGTDLSGTFEGAGGIGGLLARSHAYQSGSGSWTNHNCYHADGNGNVTYMLNSSQAKVAEYRYDPFGKTTYSNGSLASANVYRFSSKEAHVASGMYYYGFRFYDPNLQRWLNRDPIGEEGGLNLYGFVENDPVNDMDAFGLLAGAPLPAPPPTLPPILTPKPGPPIVTICTVEFCCVYAGTAYVCDKTGVHDKLGDLIYKCTHRKSDLEECKDDCYDSYLSDVEFCKGQRTKQQREYCYRQAFKLYVDCLKGCEKQFGGK